MSVYSTVCVHVNRRAGSLCAAVGGVGVVDMVTCDAVVGSGDAVGDGVVLGVYDLCVRTSSCRDPVWLFRGALASVLLFDLTLEEINVHYII